MKPKSVIKKSQEKKIREKKNNLKKGGGANALTAVGQQGAMLPPRVSLADSNVHM